MSGLRATRPVRLAVFGAAYGWSFLKANAQVAATIVTGHPRLAPVLVVVQLRCRTPAEVAAYMGLITLTPGTMAVSLTPERTGLLVHGMHAPDVAAFRADLARLEEQLLRAMRRPGRNEAASDEQKAR